MHAGLLIVSSTQAANSIPMPIVLTCPVLMQGSDVPLVTFDVTRSYANNLTASSTGGQAPAGNHGNQVLASGSLQPLAFRGLCSTACAVRK